ncbi:MAG: hypothetical protein P8K79_10085 [Mariniblastus sp.]|nr:hypothetical protein [Mariniblastus sp.]
MLRFSITTLIILTVWAALILNANLNSSRVRASRLRTGTLVYETKIAIEQNLEIQRSFKKEEPAHLRNLARLETTREFKRRLDAAFQQYTKANSDVRPVPGKISIRKIPNASASLLMDNLPDRSIPILTDEGYRYDFQVFLPDGMAARLQFELQPQPVRSFTTNGNGVTRRARPHITDFNGIDIGKPVSIALPPGQNRLSLVYQPKPGLPHRSKDWSIAKQVASIREKPIVRQWESENSAARKDRMATTPFLFTVGTGQEKRVLMETDWPTSGFSVTDPSGLDSYEQVDFAAGSHSLWSGNSSRWPFRLEAKLVIEEAANE